MIIMARCYKQSMVINMFIKCLYFNNPSVVVVFI